MKLKVFVCNVMSGTYEGIDWKKMFCVLSDGSYFENYVEKISLGDYSVDQVTSFIGKICSIECSYKKGKLVLLSIEEEVCSNVE